MDHLLAAAADGLIAIFSPTVFLYMMVGIVIGMFLGLVPGLGGLTGLGLLLPFAYTQPPEIAFAFLFGMLAVVTQTDTIPAVLLGVPGTAAAQATALDGYPMAKRGEAGRALSAAYLANIMGSLIAAIIFVACLPLLKLLIDQIAAPEFFTLAMFGLVMAASLSGTSVTRGLTMAGLGLLAAMIGFAPLTGDPRYDFGGWSYLWDGLPLVPVVLGLFSIPEAVDLLVRRSPIAGDAAMVRGGTLAGFRDSFRHWALIVRCSVIGTICGMIPGLGGVVAEWMGYGHAVQTARDRSQFGHGDVRGVIAPEVATAAQKPGAILPTVALGIPGNPAMAVLLGVFLILGLRPGPEMLDEHLDLTFMMVWITVVATIIAAGIAIVLQRFLVRLCFVRPTLIAPFVIAFMAVGAFTTTKQYGDLVVFGLFGVIGLLLRRADWPRVPFLIGLVLGGLAEPYLLISVRRYGIEFLWTRPIVAAIMVLIIVSIGLPALRARFGGRLGALRIGGEPAP